MSSDDPYNLTRFVEAQNSVFEQVRRELKAGRKTSHWMWFIFPQIQGLGHSPMAQRFAIASKEEAQAYLKHPVLGPRLEECTSVICAVQGKNADEIFGSIDGIKFRSSMTLFGEAAPDNELFHRALEKYFGGQADKMTLQKLS